MVLEIVMLSERNKTHRNTYGNDHLHETSISIHRNRKKISSSYVLGEDSRTGKLSRFTRAAETVQ